MRSGAIPVQLRADGRKEFRDKTRKTVRDPDESANILDFGLAKLIGSCRSLEYGAHGKRRQHKGLSFFSVRPIGIKCVVPRQLCEDSLWSDYDPNEATADSWSSKTSKSFNSPIIFNVLTENGEGFRSFRDPPCCFVLKVFGPANRFRSNRAWKSRSGLPRSEMHPCRRDRQKLLASYRLRRPK